MPSLLDLLRAAASGVAGGAVGWPMDTGVNLANLVRAGYGAGGKSLGLLSTQQMPEMIDPKNVPGTSEHISGLLGVGDSGQEQAVQMLAGLLSPSPGGKSKPMREAIAYHGSPHTFDKFDMSKIGTGEGAQAYGHGLYFAENPGVARSYRDTLSADKKYTVEVGGKMKDVRDTTGAENIALGSLLQSPGKSIDDVIKQYRSEQNAPYAKGWREAADYLEANKKTIRVLPEPIEGKGALYKVDLPDEHIAKMLDWDKPLSQQPEAVQKALESLPPVRAMLGGMRGKKWNEVAEHFTGRDLVTELGASGQQAETSQLLKSLGIPGIRYLDGGSRSGGKGTSNFVVFDDNIPKILGRE